MRLRTLIFSLFLASFAFTSSGCTVVEIGVANPAPNLPKIAIVPFINLSSERSVDGRRFAEAYQTELQKIPGFQVIPVGVVDSALHDYKLNLDSPEELGKLAQILDVDGICLGAVTEYTPYYPPRLGLQISWYTPGAPDFQPGIPLQPTEKVHRRWGRKASQWSESLRQSIPCFSCAGLSPEAIPHVVRAQNEPPPFPESDKKNAKPVQEDDWTKELSEAMDLEDDLSSDGEVLQKNSNNTTETITPPHSEFDETGPELVSPSSPMAFPSEHEKMPPNYAFSTPGPPSVNLEPGVPITQPYMSYTRVFDGADAKFTAALRNYLELAGDQRSGGWTGYLHRSEDFIRFCMHRSIIEMMQLHGGETKRRFILTSRKYQ